MLQSILKKIALTIFILIFGYLLLIVFVRPSNDRDWSPDQTLLPEVLVDGDLVSIKHIRNFTYKTTSDYTLGYYDATFDASKIEKAYYFVEPFTGENEGIAHTFLSFEFEGEKYIAVSIEIRKERGEEFSAVKSLFRQYELMYVVADERDVVKLRTNYRKDNVYMYPLSISKEKTKALFLSMMRRAQKLSEKPEFYNGLTSTCTSNIIDHAREISEIHVPRWHKAVIFPNYSDQLAQELGFIDETEPVWNVRDKYKINELAETYADDPDFSKRIRGK